MRPSLQSHPPLRLPNYVPDGGHTWPYIITYIRMWPYLVLFQTSIYGERSPLAQAELDMTIYELCRTMYEHIWPPYMVIYKHFFKGLVGLKSQHVTVMYSTQDAWGRYFTLSAPRCDIDVTHHASRILIFSRHYRHQKFDTVLAN